MTIKPAVPMRHCLSGLVLSQTDRQAIAVLKPLLTVLMVAGAGTVMISFFQALYQVVYVTR